MKTIFSTLLFAIITLSAHAQNPYLDRIPTDSTGITGTLICSGSCNGFEESDTDGLIMLENGARFVLLSRQMVMWGENTSKYPMEMLKIKILKKKETAADYNTKGQVCFVWARFTSLYKFANTETMLIEDEPVEHDSRGKGYNRE